MISAGCLAMTTRAEAGGDEVVELPDRSASEVGAEVVAHVVEEAFVVPAAPPLFVAVAMAAQLSRQARITGRTQVTQSRESLRCSAPRTRV